MRLQVAELEFTFAEHCHPWPDEPGKTRSHVGNMLWLFRPILCFVHASAIAFSHLPFPTSFLEQILASSPLWSLPSWASGSARSIGVSEDFFIHCATFAWFIWQFSCATTPFLAASHLTACSSLARWLGKGSWCGALALNFQTTRNTRQLQHGTTFTTFYHIVSGVWNAKVHALVLQVPYLNSNATNQSMYHHWHNIQARIYRFWQATRVQCLLIHKIAISQVFVIA